MPLNNVSVLIAHPDSLTGELLSAALNRRPRFKVVARVTTAAEVQESLKTHPTDVALISVELASGANSNFEGFRQIRASFPQVKVVLLIDDPDPKIIVNAFKAGVKGIFSPSQADFKMLCRCVDCVDKGEVWARNQQLHYVLQAFEATAQPLAQHNMPKSESSALLTKREYEVVRLLAEGLTNREIARRLTLSEHTIKNYLFHVFDKLGVSNRTELLLQVLSPSGVPMNDQTAAAPVATANHSTFSSSEMARP